MVRPMTSPQRRRNTIPDTSGKKGSGEAPTIVTVAKNEPRLPLERIGDILRTERQRRGDDLDQIAEYLCIRRNFLAALESNRYDELPADAYVIGFLRSYAEILGLDGKNAIDRYRHEMAGRRKKPALSIPTPITEGRAPSAVIMSAAAIVALLIYAIWYGLSTSDRAAVTVAPALPTAAIAETAPEPTSHTTTDTLSNSTATATATPVPPIAATTQLSPATPAAPAATAPPAGAAIPHLTITADEACWILISDSNGKAIFDRVMKTGEVYKVPDTKGLSLTTGNGGGIRLTLDGAILPKLANNSSRVIRNIPLDSRYLKALPALPE
jgi:cytoskeleton protein RodZ